MADSETGKFINYADYLKQVTSIRTNPRIPSSEPYHVRFRKAIESLSPKDRERFMRDLRNAINERGIEGP